MFAVLTHRMLIGVFIGAMSSKADPEDEDNRVRQTICLMAVSIAFLGYIGFIRPYHVPVEKHPHTVYTECSAVQLWDLIALILLSVTTGQL